MTMSSSALGVCALSSKAILLLSAASTACVSTFRGQRCLHSLCGATSVQGVWQCLEASPFWPLSLGVWEGYYSLPAGASAAAAGTKQPSRSATSCARLLLVVEGTPCVVATSRSSCGVTSTNSCRLQSLASTSVGFVMNRCVKTTIWL